MNAKRTPAPAKSKPKGASPVKQSGKAPKPAEKSVSVLEWLQDASLEVMPAATASYAAGARELEFSVGLRRQPMMMEGVGEMIRSELRGRALIHAAGSVLALAEASYVVVVPTEKGWETQDQTVAQSLYKALKPHLENLLGMSGHTPPLPKTLESAN